VEFCNFSEISSFIEEKLNAKVQHHSLRIEGLCSQCRRKKSP
jgi:Fe2+ or Zn2+ uptake regulation protein